MGGGGQTDAGGSRPARRGARILKLAVSAAAIWAVSTHVDGRALVVILRSADVFAVLATFVLYLAGQLLTAYRWQIIARRAGFDESTPRVIAYYYIGMFFNLFGPSTLGGDVVRSLYLASRDGRRAVALHTVLFDRISGLAMLVAVAVVAMALFGSFGIPTPLVRLTWGTSLAILVGWWALPPLVRGLLRPDHVLRRHVDDELDVLWRDRSLLVKVALLSVVFHTVQISALILLGHAVNLRVPWQYYFVFHPLVTVFSALPISLAGLGIREMGYVYFLTDLQAVPREAALGLAILWLTVLVGASVVGGIVFAMSGTEVPSLRGRGKGKK